MEQKKVLSKKVSAWVLVVAVVGGVGGALILGHLLETVARSIFGLNEWDIPGLIIWGAIMALLASIGTLAVVGAVYTENKVVRWLIVAFSIPIPIVIEIVDLTIRMIAMVNDLYIYHGLI